MNFKLPFSYITSSLPDFVVALMFLVTWIEPEALGNDMLNTMAIVIFLEFFIIHSAAFMTAVFFMKKNIFIKILIQIGLGVFYSIFVIVFTAGYGTLWPLASFWMLIANRMLTMLSGPQMKESNMLMPAAAWGVSVFFYVIGIFIFLAIPVPDFGITKAFAEKFVVKNFWIETPASIMAFGFFYYFVVGVAQFIIFKKSTSLSVAKQ